MAFDSYNNTLQFDCPNTDTIYFSGLPTDITEDEVAKFFGQLGTIKMDKKKRPPAPKVWLYKDKETGVLKGDGTIAFEDPFAAGSAVSWFNGTEFRGNKISVSLAQRKGQEPPSWGGGGGGRSRGYGGRGGGGGYGGDRRGYDDRRGGGYQDHRGGYGRDRGGYDGGRGGGYDGGRGGGYDGGRGGGGYDRGMGGYEGGYGPDPRYDQPPPSRYDQEPPQRVSDQGGRFEGGGRGGPPPPKEMREGDWLCECGNTNFAFRGKCNRCQAPRPSGGSSRGDDGGRGRGRDDRAKVTAAPQGPAGLFSPDDWACPSCGNMNWARRPRCNLCNTSKPGTTDTKREGTAGGFKEIDHREIEEARERRRQYEEADEYDDFGRLKKKFRSGRH